MSLGLTIRHPISGNWSRYGSCHRQNRQKVSLAVPSQNLELYQEITDVTNIFLRHPLAK
jgi:hypothetical protein